MSVYSDAAALILSERWAAIATIHEGQPLASHVAFAVEPGLTGLLFHISQMAAHTQALLEDPRACLAVGRPDTGDGDPQLLARVSLSGKVTAIEPDSGEFEVAKAVYVKRFPAAEMRFELGDFILFRFEIETARWVGGFGRAARMTGQQLAEAGAKE
jgi:putative heme iron utilization protein